MKMKHPYVGSGAPVNSVALAKVIAIQPTAAGVDTPTPEGFHQ